MQPGLPVIPKPVVAHDFLPDAKRDAVSDFTTVADIRRIYLHCIRRSTVKRQDSGLSGRFIVDGCRDDRPHSGVNHTIDSLSN